MASPVYYNLTLFPGANTALEPNGGKKLRNELTSYLRLQARDTGVIVLLLDSDGNVISDQGEVDPNLVADDVAVAIEQEDDDAGVPRLEAQVRSQLVPQLLAAIGLQRILAPGKQQVRL